MYKILYINGANLMPCLVRGIRFVFPFTWPIREPTTKGQIKKIIILPHIISSCGSFVPCGNRNRYTLAGSQLLSYCVNRAFINALLSPLMLQLFMDGVDCLPPCDPSARLPLYTIEKFSDTYWLKAPAPISSWRDEYTWRRRVPWTISWPVAVLTVRRTRQGRTRRPTPPPPLCTPPLKQKKNLY